MNFINTYATSVFSGGYIAYIDPSLMTYVIQAVAAVAVTFAAVAGIHFRNAKKKAMKVLNIEENNKKEIEDDVIEIDPDSKI